MVNSLDAVNVCKTVNMWKPSLLKIIFVFKTANAFNEKMCLKLQKVRTIQKPETSWKN